MAGNTVTHGDGSQVGGKGGVMVGKEPLPRAAALVVFLKK